MAESDLKKQVVELQQQVEDLSVLCRALQECLIRKKVLTRQEIKALRDEIDASDGAMDGKVTKVMNRPKGE